jgi:hypothetical protein
MRAIFMNPNNTRPSNIERLTDILAAGEFIAVTAPMISNGEAFICYCSAEKSGCAVIPAADTKFIVRTLYEPKINAITVHGLNRMWEKLNVGSRDVKQQTRPVRQHRMISIDTYSRTKTTSAVTRYS